MTLNGKAVALIDKDGYMWAGTTDFKVNTRTNERYEQLYFILCFETILV